MEREKEKKRLQLSTTLDAQILRRMRNYSEKTGIPISRMIDRAMGEYLDRREGMDM